MIISLRGIEHSKWRLDEVRIPSDFIFAVLDDGTLKLIKQTPIEEEDDL